VSAKCINVNSWKDKAQPLTPV